MEIKDSGNRRQFETGFVRDMAEGKGRMDLLPWTAILELSKHCENGAKKYGERNVDKGAPQHSLLDSALRHLAKYMEGWDDEDHLLAAFWNIAWAVQQNVTKPEMQDIPNILNKMNKSNETISASEENLANEILKKIRESENAKVCCMCGHCEHFMESLHEFTGARCALKNMPVCYDDTVCEEFKAR